MISIRRVLTIAGVAASGGTLLLASAATGSSVARDPGKPVIGNAVAAPAQPQAGKKFTVTFKVTDAKTGTALTVGKMTCAATVAGTVVPNTATFRGGTARLSLLVPADAGGKALKVKVTIKTPKGSATKAVTFKVKAAPIPSVSIGDVSAAEGSGSTTAFSFPVTLSAPATQTVSVDFKTADGTAKAPSDYASAGGTLTFKTGEKAKTIVVNVVADTIMEPDETFTVALSNPVNTTIARGTATGTITNDDVAVAVTPGNYVGTQGNYVYITVLPNRTVTGFRTNSLTENCSPGGYIQGAVDWGTKNSYPIANDGSFNASAVWSGSDVNGDVEFTNESWQVTGLFSTPTTVSGTFILSDELNYQGTHFKCSTGTIPWSATLQQ